MINLRSIRFRLVALHTVLILVVAAVFGEVIYQQIEAHLQRTVATTLRHRAEQIAFDILPLAAESSADDLVARIDTAYSPRATDRFIRITTRDGRLVYRSPMPEDSLFDPATIPQGPRVPGTRWETLGDDEELFIVTAAGRYRGEDVLIETGGSGDGMTTVLKDLRRNLLISLPIVAFMVSVGGYWLVMRSLRPVERLSATAEEITFGDLDKRLPVVSTGDEIEHLSVRLNQMLDRLSRAYRQATRFSADASHELRTPLAIIRAELESIIRDTGDLPPTVMRRVQSTLEEVERISFITECLFKLSRLDAGEAKFRSDRIDLTDLVRTTVEQMQLLTVDKDIRLSIRADADVVVLGDAARLKQLLVALLDNAVKYTPAGGSILLTVSAVDQRAHLCVRDSGIGISAEDLPHVFERFFRADKARSRGIDGAGLGLPIVRSICEAHGGTVEVTSVQGQGTTCDILLPLAA